MEAWPSAGAPEATTRVSDDADSNMPRKVRKRVPMKEYFLIERLPATQSVAVPEGASASRLAARLWRGASGGSKQRCQEIGGPRDSNAARGGCSKKRK